jgi:hypothetical protein
MSVESQIRCLNEELPSTVKLVAVSKFKSIEDISKAYNAGQKCFGENRPQELVAKASVLPKNIEWHFIGHLQTNKIKMLLPYVTLIHSVDSEKLLFEINKAAFSAGLSVDCLLQVHIAKEETKQGFSLDEITYLIDRLESFKNIRIRGLMGMASFVQDSGQVRNEFRSLFSIFEKISKFSGNSQYNKTLSDFNQLSMGMSHDYKIAIEEGATIVRIGSFIFGERT